MKKTMILLPKFLYAAISIFVVLGLAVFGAREGLFEEGKIQNQQSNHRQTEGNGGLQVEIDDGIAKISDDWFHDSNFLNMNATNKQIVANKKLIVNNANLNFGFRLGNGVITMPAMNQPAERLTNQSDAKANQISTGRNIIKSVAAIQSVVNQWGSAAGGGFAEAVDHRGQSHQYQSQGKDRHNQIEGSKFVHDVLPANHSAISQNARVPVTPYIRPVVQLLSNRAGTKIEPIEISPAPTAMSTKALNWPWFNIGFRGTNTSSSSAIEADSNIADNWLSILVPKAYAAETTSAKPIPLSLYQPLAGQIMFREALEKLPIEQRTPEKIAELITGISQLLSSLPAKGEIFLSGGKFSGLTGTSGILSGKVVKGTYRIKIDPVEGIDLIVPAAVEAGLHGPETVMIGLTPGKGKVKTTAEIGNWKKIFSGLGEKVLQVIGKTSKVEDSRVLAAQTQAEIGDALPTAVLTIQLFRDSNKNGVYDSGESLVEWAGVKMDLEPTTQSSSYNLTEGWNLIAFPVTPTSITTAAEAVGDIAKEGGYVTTISTWEGDKWIEYSQRGAAKFGHDFGLVPGRAYFLESQMNSVWTVAGTPLPAENQVIQLRKGWNGVGIPKEGATAVQMMDEIQITENREQRTASGEIADQVGRWDFGLWDVVVKRRYSPEHHEIYGRDFPIKDIEGYFIHANEDVRLQ